MKKIFLPLGMLVAALALLNGCASGGVSRPMNTDKYNYDENSPFVLFDAGAQRSVTCSGTQLGKTADGRMKVTTHLRNRENRRIEVQANCVFKDAQGFTVDETPFRAVFLDENATQDVSFEAMNLNAAKYTIRVRQAR